MIYLVGDVNFAPDLSDLRHRKRYEVVLVHKNQVSEALQIAASECHSYEDLVNDLPERQLAKVTINCFHIVN